MKNFMNTMMVVIMMATLVFFGFAAGMNKDKIVKWYNYGCELATENTGVIVSDDNYTENIEAIVSDDNNKDQCLIQEVEEIETMTHSYGKKIENENPWRTANGYFDSNYRFYGTFLEVEMYTFTHPGVCIFWISEEEGYSGRTIYDQSTGYFYTFDLNEV